MSIRLTYLAASFTGLRQRIYLQDFAKILPRPKIVTIRAIPQIEFKHKGVHVS
jgi:hypothetical protein